jgi:hypothetical protein
LTTLSVETATALGHHEYGLSLDGLRVISDEAFRALIKTRRNAISLDGLTALTDPQIKLLAKHSPNVSLNGLTEISDVGAASLRTVEGGLHLDGLATLSETAAQELSQCPGALSLNGLRRVPPEVLQALAKHKGDRFAYLNLDGLDDLPDELAEVFASQEGALSLNGLQTLTDNAARALSRRKGEIHLDGIKTLSDSAAKALASHEGDMFTGVSLQGLEKLSKDAAAALMAKGEYGGIRLSDRAVSEIEFTGQLGMGYLGVAFKQAGVPTKPAISVTAVAPGSPAETAGVKTGDVVTALDGKAVRNKEGFFEALADIPIGTKVSIDVQRGGTGIQLPVIVGKRPATP